MKENITFKIKRSGRKPHISL